ncbi:MAG: hypothetical protein ACTHN3_02055 [Solirubrobacterales bacterium]
MERGPIPLNLHAALEPLMAVIVIAAPWIFQFSETTSATVICVAVGVTMLLVGSMTALMTRWDRSEAEPTYTRERGAPRDRRVAH